MEPLINKTVLMSDVDSYEGVVELNLYSDEMIQPDKELARREHESVAQALGAIGIRVVRCTSAAGWQDSVYTANWAYCRQDTALAARLPNARKGEEKHSQRILKKLGKRIVYPPDYIERYSGQGDTLVCGNVLFVGSGYRTDIEMADYIHFLWPDYTVVPVQTIPALDENGQQKINDVSGWEDSEFYDIDLAMAILRPTTQSQSGLIGICRDAFTSESIERIQKVCREKNISILDIDYNEAVNSFACNLISNGNSGLVMSQGAPRFASTLKQNGFTVFERNLAELNKAGGGGRCIGLTLDND